MESKPWKDVAAEALTQAVVAGLIPASTASAIVEGEAPITVTVILPLPEGGTLVVGANV